MSLNTKITFLLFCLTIASSQLLAQAPVNDDCDGLIDLGVAPYCPDVAIPGNETEIYTNVDATATDIGFGNNPSCFSGGTAQRDVWFAFTTSDTIFDYTITVMGVEGPDGEPSIVNPQLALYRGACEFNNLAELLCVSADPGETMIELDVEGLTPNITYYLRINDYSGTATPNAGSFKLCIDEQDPINLITDGMSSSCTGELFDSGGPDGDYGNNENNVFTICPDQPNQCINFSLSYFNIEPLGDFTNGDQLIFYDGPIVNPATIISSIGGFDFESTQATSGVCFEVQASSGCLTVQFISDPTVTFTGFAGSWECATTPCVFNDPVSIDMNASEQDIINALSTPLTQTTITNIDCADVAYGTFEAGDNSDLGLQRGLLLTSGNATYAAGPNNSFGNTLEGDLFLPGDMDLDTISTLFGNGERSQDACVIELEVVANTNELSFEYVFGSEEYPEFVDDIYNDIFAFLISGPGITGLPALNGQENIATIPGSNTFVEINTVNNLLNWEYYRNNEDGLSIQYDGLTSDYFGVKKSLTARATVEPCSTYQLKLAIADRGDGIYDSGVFISELSGGSPELTIDYNSGIDFLIEDCTSVPDEIVFSLNNTLDEDVTYTLLVTGTATPTVDYELDLPETITFPPGENEIRFPLTVLSDLDDLEGIENIIISIVNDFGCGLVELASLEIELRDQLLIEINEGRDTARVCAGNDVLLSVEGASSYFWTPVSIFDDPLSSTPLATPLENGWVNVEGQVGICTATDSIYLLILDPVVNIAEDEIPTCQTEPVRLAAANNTNGEGLSWSPEFGLSDPTAAITMANPASSTLYTVTVDLGSGCMASDQVLVNVEFFNVPVLAADTTICQHSGLTLAELLDPDISTTNYNWTPNTGFDNPGNPTPEAFPDETTNYELIGTTLNGACSDTSNVLVTVLPADVNIVNQPDTLLLCLGDPIDLFATTNTGSAENLVWTSDDGIVDTADVSSITVTPATSGFYFTTFTVGECVVMDSIFIQVDSLPADLSITVEPFEETYCQGELVTLVSPAFQPGFYQDITHQWTGIGIVSPDTLYNLVFTTTDTFTYQRVTMNGACTSVDSVIINVIVNDALMISPAAAEICPGESVALLASSTGALGELSWSPAETLSCDDCPDPIAMPTTTTTYTLSSDIEGCAIEQSVTVNVLSPDQFQPINSQAVCSGDLPMALNPNGAGAGTTYSWVSDPPGFTSMDANPMVSPTSTTTYIGTATTACGESVREITLTVIEPGAIIDIAEGADTLRFCQGDAFTLSANVQNSPNGVETFVWEYDGLPVNSVDAEFIALDSGLATFTYSYGTGATTCSTSSASVFISVSQAPQQVDLIDNQIVCFNDPGTFILNNNSGEPGVVYSWSGTDGFSSMEPDPEVTPTATTTYTLVATQDICSFTDSVTISIINPVVLTAGETQIAQPDGNGQLQAVDLTAMAEGITEDQFMWTFGNAPGTFIGSGSNLIWVPEPVDSLPDYAYVSIDTGCELLIDSILIQRLDYRVPDIFSPNNDGQNDIFKPFYLGEMDVVEVRVYNRWGKLVFESNDASNPGWNGTYNDKLAPSDVYIWQVKVGLGGEIKSETGQVTLLR